MTDPDLNNKLDRLLTLLEAQLELTRQVSFNLDEQEDINYEKIPASWQSLTGQSPLPPLSKVQSRDMEIFILEAEAWFKFNQVYEQSRMINHMGAQLEGTAREWWTSKLRIDRAREGRLFNDWHYFTERLSEQFNPCNARMEAYNKLLALRLTSDAPGAATRHVEWFRDLEGQVNLDDNELVIDLFRGSLTRSIQEKFERNPPGKRWEWYREVEEIDRQRMLLQQSSARHSLPNAMSPPLRTGSRPNQSSIPIRQPTQPYPARSPSQATTQATIQNLNRPLPHHPTQPSKQGSPAPSGINTCHVCKGIGHWARDCPSRRVDPLSSRPMGPKVMVTTADPFEEATDSGDGHTGSTETGDPKAMDLSSYQQPMDPDHEEEHNDDDDEGNVSGFCEHAGIYWYTQSGLKPTIQWDTGQLEFKTQEQDRPPRRPPEAARAGCHGPGCSRSRRVTGSYGRSTGIEDLVDTSREHGRSAVSMETMDSYGFTCKGALSPYARRTRHSHEEDQAQRAGAATRRTKLRWLPLRGSRDRKLTQVMRRRSSVEGVDTGHEEEEQCRRSRHHSRGTGVPSRRGP
ncbi:hypothetical protein NDA11_000474 [Ustilago hordei]|nr:hypothetical protein NDA11_000474 [Ustilago hordei]